jgi:hypothetical protein
LLVLVRRHVAEFFVEPFVVVEADPVQRLMLGVFMTAAVPARH